VQDEGAETVTDTEDRHDVSCGTVRLPRVAKGLIEDLYALFRLADLIFSYDGDEQNRPDTARAARNVYPLLRPGRPIDSQFGANFAYVNGSVLVPIACGNPQPFCDIDRPL
jgi:hypothetical protein